MIDPTNGSMDLIISEPIYFPKLSKTQPFISKLTNNYNREIECNHPEVKLRKRSNNNEILSVITIDKNINRLSPICDEQFPLTIPSDKPTTKSSSSSSSSQAATRFARRHFHIYDWTRLSFYDNVPPPFDYLSEPVIIEDRSPTSISSTDDKRSSLDRKDSGLGTSSIDKPTDSIQLSTNLNRSTSSSSSHSRSSYSSNLSCQTATRRIRVKWHSFTKTHRPSFNSSKYNLGQMSVGQLLSLRRAALIRIQELFDTTRILSLNKTVQTRPHFLATAFTAVPKLIIRKHQQRKENHHQIKRTVFGVSLLSMTQRTGHPVPLTIISAMKYLRRTSIDSVGIFRKPGVSHRIKRLHDLIESNLEFHQFDDFSPYDVSDVLKQYFRLLPECLFTNKLSPLFLHIQEHFSLVINKTNLIEERLLALQYAILLLPDENRLVLHLLLSFLNDVSQHSTNNQMSSINLATCFAPTLFSFHYSSKHSTHGMPDLREIQEQRKAMNILAFMIDHVRYLFLIPNELHQACHFSYIEIGEPCTLDELGHRATESTVRKPAILFESLTSPSSSSEELSLNINNNNNNRIVKRKNNVSYQNFLDRCMIEILRESCSKKVKGWTSFGKVNQIELAFKKLDDGHPLGLWKCAMEIEAPPIEILNRLLNERNLWDDDFQSGNIVEELSRYTHVYQYTINSMAPLASRYFCEVRSWRTNIRLNSEQRKEVCALVCMSIEHPKGRCPSTSVRAVTLASRYLIQSNGCGKSKVTHLSRVDLMGRSQDWYTKVYGSILTRSMMKLRDSFSHVNSGQETKI